MPYCLKILTIHQAVPPNGAPNLGICGPSSSKFAIKETRCVGAWIWCRILRFHRRDSSLEIRAKIMRHKISPSIIFLGLMYLHPNFAWYKIFGSILQALNNAKFLTGHYVRPFRHLAIWPDISDFDRTSDTNNPEFESPGNTPLPPSPPPPVINYFNLAR